MSTFTCERPFVLDDGGLEHSAQKVARCLLEDGMFKIPPSPLV